MKKYLICLSFFSILLSQTNAQCVPDTSVTHNLPGIYPDSATGLPHAVVGTAYSTVIQVMVPQDTTYLGLPAIITSINVTNVTGLPPGFSYSCTPSNCIFPGNSNACILIQGPAPTVGQIGTYPMVVDLEIHGTVFGSPQTVSDSNDNYSIIIDNAVGIGINHFVSSTFEVSQNHPNPFHGFSEITVSSPANESVNFKISDLIGNTVFSKNFNFQRGINRIPLFSSDLEPGIYLYTVSNGKTTVVRRMIVSSNP